MEIRELQGVSEKVLGLLAEAGIHDANDIRNAGRDGLLAIGGIGPKTADMILSLLPSPLPANRQVTVRNDSDSAILVGERYIFPEDVRTIFAFQVVDGLTVLKEE